MDGEFELGTTDRNGDRGRGCHVLEDDEEENVLVERNGEFILLPKKELEALDLFIADKDNDRGGVHTGEELNRTSEAKQESLHYPVVATSCETTSCTNTTSSSTSSRPFPDSPTPPPAEPASSPPPVTRARLAHSPTLSSHEGRVGGSPVPGKSARQPINSYVPPALIKKYRLSSAPSSTRKPSWSPAGQKAPVDDSHTLGAKQVACSDNSSSPDVGSDKKLRNEQAFQEWLAHKRGQSPAFGRPRNFVDGGVERPSTALPRTCTWPAVRTNSDAFENWLKRKQVETKVRRGVDFQRKSESPDLERSLDGDKAFQSWLERKKGEERTRAQEFRAYHRVQIEEARKIKWSLDQRYKGMK